MDTIGERLRHARVTAHERLGLSDRATQGEVGDKIGLTQGAIGKLENNQNKRGDVDVIKLMKAAEYLKCSFIWLATGRGSLTNDDSNLLDDFENHKGQPFYPPDDLQKKNAEPEMQLNLTDKLISKVSPNSFYTLVSDNGLTPKAAAGDMVLVDPSAEIQVGDYVLVRIKDKKLPVVRRIVERSTEDGQHGYMLKCLNNEFADRPLEKLEDLAGVVMEFRSFTREDTSYKDQLSAISSANIIKLPL